LGAQPNPERRPGTANASAVDAAQFGANGADDADDTLALQAAIDAARARPGAVVQLSAGTFYISDQAPLDQVCLRVDGATGLAIRGAGEGATRLVLRSKRDAHMLAFSGSSRVEASGLSFDGTRSGGPRSDAAEAPRKDTHGVRVAECDDVYLSHLNIRATAHYGIGLQAGALRHIRIQHVQIDDTGGDGIDFKNSSAANEDISLEDIQVFRPGQLAPRQTGIDIRGRAVLHDIRVTGVPEGATGIRFREDGAATGPGGHDSTLERFQVQGAPGSTGVAIAADHVTIRGGKIEGTDTGVSVLGAAARVDNVSVSGARLAFRIEVAGADALLTACHGDSSRAGLWLEGPRAHVEHGQFCGNRQCGICLRPGALAAALVDNDFCGSPNPVEDATGTGALP
jgi:hypothetical protein